MMELFINKAIFTPFVEKGRDYDGWDCWGLVYRYYYDFLNIRLPVYLDGYSSTRDYEELKHIIGSNKERWAQTDERKEGNVALFKLAKRPIHMGLVIDKKRFIHAEEVVGTIIETFNSPLWNKRLEGIYEYIG